MRTRKSIISFLILVVFFISACGINFMTQSPDLELTAAVQALNIQQTQVALNAAQQNAPNQVPPAVIVVTATLQAAPPAPANTVGPAPTQQPQMVNSTLCWVGPGNKYEVVSSLSKGQFVEVIGRGNIPNWIIIKNPIYTDPCWVQAFDIKLDPGVDISSLQVYYAPPPPTKTPTPVPTATHV